MSDIRKYIELLENVENNKHYNIEFPDWFDIDYVSESDFEMLFYELIPEYYRELFMHGSCQVFAFQLHKRIKNSKLVTILDYDLDIDHEVVTHVMVMVDNLFIDIEGIYTDVNNVLNQFEDLGEQTITTDMTVDEIKTLTGDCDRDLSTIANKLSFTVFELFRLYRDTIH